MALVHIVYLAFLFQTFQVDSLPRIQPSKVHQWTPTNDLQTYNLPRQINWNGSEWTDTDKTIVQWRPAHAQQRFSQRPIAYRTAVDYGALSSRADKECKGFDNLLSDIGVISYGLGFIGTLIGFFTMLISFVTQIQTVLSTYVVGVPSSLLTLNNFFGDPSAVSTTVANVISMMGIVDNFINLTFATNVNGLVNITDIFGAIISFTSLYLGAGSTFPNAVKYVLKELLGSDPERFFASYGC